MAMKLRLPRSWGIHPTFHVKLLEPFRSSNSRDEIDLEQVLEEMEGLVTSTEYEPEEVMGSTYSRVRNKVLYLVKWKDFPEREDWTKEPQDHLWDGYEDLVCEYHRRYPGRIQDDRLVIED